MLFVSPAISESAGSTAVVAAVSLCSAGQHLCPACRLPGKHRDEGGAAAPPPPSGSTPAGHDDGLGPILPDLGSLLLHADKPNARRSCVHA